MKLSRLAHRIPLLRRLSPSYMELSGSARAPMPEPPGQAEEPGDDAAECVEKIEAITETEKEVAPMRQVSDLIRVPGLWGGLNAPLLPMEEADIVVCGIPFDGGASFRKGAGEAPRRVREITFSICPTTEDFEVIDFKLSDQGDIDEQDRDALFEEVRERTESYVRAGKFFTFIGGDHSVSIPIMAGLDRALGHEFGIIHIDAHFDLCDELGGDRLSHGCTERRALELINVSGLENIFFVGIRSAETCEAEYLADRDANVISASRFRRLGTKEVLKRIKKKMKRFESVYVTIDIDALDPAYAPGTGTPQLGGLDPRELLDLLRGVMELPVVGFDLVEVAPPLDPSDITLFAARKILTECWGHRWRKTRKAGLA